jgi:1,4-alpha-glucan branching enzyme
MHRIAVRYGESPGPDPLARRALNQAGRSLLLAQASDWAFIMKTGTAVEYAQGRIRDHLARCHWLIDAVEAGTVDGARLAALETMDNIFPELDFRIWA